jgi:hypothetical protein
VSGAPNDGGPAFPVVWQDVPHGGMTLRDWFAGQALAGMLAGNPTESPNEEWFAGIAYTMADAMLVERERKS